MDCVTSDYGCNGCAGGYPEGAMDWLLGEKVGSETEDNYPYTSYDTTGTCMYAILIFS